MPSVTPIDTERTHSIRAYASLAVATLGIAPGLETALRTQLGFSPGAVGLLFLFELGGMALASWPCGRLLACWGPRPVARAALMVWSVAGLLSIAGLSHLAALLACRAVAGLGAGTMMILALEGAGRSRRPRRALSAAVVAQLATGAALLAALPSLLAAGGLAAVFLVEALAGLSALALSPPLDSRSSAGNAPARAEVTAVPVAWGVLAVALPFNIAIGAIWSFVAKFAPPDAMPVERVDDVLAAATLLGVVAAAAAGLTGTRWSARLGTGLGIGGLVAGTALVALWHQVPGFLAGTMLLSFAWNFSVPFLMALGAAQADAPSSMGTVNLSFASGLAIGPPVGGWLLQAGGPSALASGTVLGFLVVLAALAAGRA